jgi:hypothetical protein
VVRRLAWVVALAYPRPLPDSDFIIGGPFKVSHSVTRAGTCLLWGNVMVLSPRSGTFLFGTEMTKTAL